MLGPLVVFVRSAGGRWRLLSGSSELVALTGEGFPEGGRVRVVDDEVLVEVPEGVVRQRVEGRAWCSHRHAVVVRGSPVEVAWFIGRPAELSARALQAVEAVRADDRPETRNVLADVLEESGAIAHAEYVRLEVELQRTATQLPEFEDGVIRLKALSALVGPAFRFAVGRDIEGCTGLRWSFRCPKTWESLQRTQREGERICTTCRQTVVQAESERRADALARQGICTSLQLPERPVGEVAVEHTWVGSIAVPRPVDHEPPEPEPEPVAPATRKPWWRRLLGR
jgi:hypothetical protein